MPGLLSDAEIGAAISARPGWTRRGDAIERSFELPSFAAAVAFVVRVGFLAEALDHHPDLDLRWRTVRVSCSTHSAGGITANDLELASAIDLVAP